jgi:16S rRNA (uracil1498-N3)-methyltransferase
MDRFFHPAGLSRSALSLDEAESHHAARVLRKQPGDCIELFDGRGQSAIAEITLVKKDRVEVRVVELREPLIAPHPAIRLAVAPPKGDRFRWLVEKATELGIDQLIPMLTERTVVEPGAGKLDKLQAAVVAACKQSGRDLVMLVTENTPFTELMVACRSANERAAAVQPPTEPASSADAHRTLLLGDPQGEMFQPEMLPHETGEVFLLIGPEGGWSDAELEQATLAGARRVRFADQILRTETAALQLAGLCVWARSLHSRSP